MHALKLRDKINSSTRLYLHLTINEEPTHVEYLFKEYIENTTTVTVSLSYVIPTDVDMGSGMSYVYKMVSHLEKIYQQGL